MNKTFQKFNPLSDYSSPLEKAEALLGENRLRYKEQAKNYKINIATLIGTKTRELSYERRLQERPLVQSISGFLTQVSIIMTEDLLETLSSEMRTHVLAFFQANAINHYLSQLPQTDHGQGFFQRIKRREAIGENKLQVISHIQTLPHDEVLSKLKALLAADVERIIDSPEPFSPLSLTQFVQNLQTLTAKAQDSHQRIEDDIRQQLTYQDEVLYGLYKIVSYNRFFNIGRSLFLAAEQASKDDRFKNIPGNVPLDPAFITFFSTVSGLLYLYSTLSQFGVSGTLLLSALTQTTTDLECSTWVGAKMNLSTEETLRITANIGHGFSLKDIAQFSVIILQVMMELGDQHNTTIARAIAGSLMIYVLAGTVTEFVTGKIDKTRHSKLMPIISICSFFSAVRFISYGFNLMSSGLTLLYQSYDQRYGNKAPEEILMDPVLCDVRREECKSVALNLFKLPPEPSSRDVKNAYKKMTEACHPDLSSGDTTCLLIARAAKNILTQS